jgi:hypothetical protein
VAGHEQMPMPIGDGRSRKPTAPMVVREGLRRSHGSTERRRDKLSALLHQPRPAAPNRQLTRSAVSRNPVALCDGHDAVSRSRQRDPGGHPHWTAARADARSSSRGERDARRALPRRLHAVRPMDLHITRSLTPGWPAPLQSPAELRRGNDLVDRKAGEGPARRARQLQVRNPLLRALARVLGVRTRDRAWRVGADGERKVGRKLDRLHRRGWHVLHGVELGRGGDVDHLLVGRVGVFTVNTKHHPGARVTVGRSVVVVRGRQQPYAAKALREASRVRMALSTATGGWSTLNHW